MLKKQDHTPPPSSPDSNWPMVESEVIRHEDEVQIDNCKVKLYNVDRELWKGVTKADVIQYYVNIAPYRMPHIKDRPLHFI